MVLLSLFLAVVIGRQRPAAKSKKGGAVPWVVAEKVERGTLQCRKLSAFSR